MSFEPKLIIHGGAWDIPSEFHEAHRRGVENACNIGLQVLKRRGARGTAVEACLAAVRALEDDPTFDAGTGSFLNAAAEVEMDAILMDGKDLSLGSVAAVQCVKNPIELANTVRTLTDHCLLAGPGALEFAKDKRPDLIVDPSDLVVGRERELLVQLKNEQHKPWDSRKFFAEKESDKITEISDNTSGSSSSTTTDSNLTSASPENISNPEETSNPTLSFDLANKLCDLKSQKPSKMGTVGCVAMDRFGNIVAATSTGGTPNKMPGRVGDTPLVGCGCYADSRFAGVSSTGWGEALMRTVLAKKAVDYVEILQETSSMQASTDDDQQENLAQKAVDRAILRLGEEPVNGVGGLICIDKDGSLGFAYNTPHMARAMGTESGGVYGVAI